LNIFFLKNTPNQVTLVTQLSLDRLALFENLLTHWTGPISATFYASDAELVQLLEYVEQAPHFVARNDLAIHVVFKEGVRKKIFKWKLQFLIFADLFSGQFSAQCRVNGRSWRIRLPCRCGFSAELWCII
jgi:hypothetical protein